MLQKNNNQLNFAEIFNNSQHVTSSDLALTQLKKLYKSTEFRHFEGPFKHFVKKLFQSKQTIYFKTSCEFLCKFLQHVSKLSQHSGSPTKAINTNHHNTTTTTSTGKPSRATGAKANTRSKRGVKRKADVSDDELVLDVAKENITDHDRVVSTCIDVADHYMQVKDEECRLNAVFFICKFLSYVESLDEEICTALKLTLPKRVRDRRPMIRAQAVLASRIFQDNPMTQEAFMHHFYRDPELVVRKALLQIMDTKIFGYDFLVDATQDAHEVMRKATFQRLGKISPSELNLSQLHRVIHNGLNERDRQASYSFKTHTLEPWLTAFYDGIDLYKLLEPFDVTNYHDDVCRLLELIYVRDLEKLESNGATTKLHQVVESFRERWLNTDNNCLPSTSQIDERVTVIWLTLIKFCKSNQTVIKSVKVRTIQPKAEDPNESIERILNSQEQDDEVAELYERLTPDLVNLVDFLKRFVQHAAQVLKREKSEVTRLEYIFHQIMQFVYTYEIGDELERKTVQEVFDFILRENLLTGSFQEFITPIIKALFNLIYSSSSNLMINYISEMINNVRSHLEDLAAPAKPPPSSMALSKILAPGMTPKSTKKVRINAKPKRTSYAADLDPQNLEYKIATIRVELEELKDKLDDCVKEKDFDQAKTINSKMSDLNSELNMLHDRRCSIASDVSHMSMVIETEPADDKLSSTMIGDASMTEEQSCPQDKDVKIFRNNSNELLKCLQMYYGCLQCVKINEVPMTMLNHLAHLSYECLDEWFKENTRVRSLMVACNGVTALTDRSFALGSSTLTLMLAACYDPNSIEIRTTGFRCLVDVWCQHDELKVPVDKVEKFLNSSLRDYGKYDPRSTKKNELEFITSIIEGTTKLFYLRKLDSSRILSHLILWWYHPRTDSRLKQFIGMFLPTFVDDTSRRQQTPEDTWLRDLLEETFVTSIEFLHEYILGPGYNMMAASDLHSLINFLCNLIPVSFHKKIIEKVDDRIDDLTGNNPDLLKYLKLSKNSLSSSVTAASNVQTPLARPIQIPE